MITRRSLFVATAIAASVLASTPVSLKADDDHHRDRFVFATLRGANEVPSISTTAKGTFSAKIDDQAGTIEYKLTYSDLVGTTVTQAHVHFANKRVNGGVSFFLCGGGPQNLPCPAAPGTVTGTISAADVIGPTAQGILAGEFVEIVAAIRAGLAYANVHTNTFPGGEARGQIQ
jgi:hypothetical protein